MFENPTEATNPSGIKIKLAIGLVILALLLATTAMAFFSAQTRARDQVRIADIKQIQKFLLAYKQNEGVYPIANVSDQPRGWEEYLESYPSAPIPADGRCTQDQNTYKYTPQAQRQEFRLAFCLGKGIGEYSSGTNVIED